MKRAYVLALALLGGLAQAAELDIEVQGLADGQGQVMVAAFGTADGWLRRPVAVAREAAAGQQQGVLRLRLKDLPEGPVALSVFHDRNGNGRLDMNAMGLPLEPFAFSNNASGAFGPPSFEQARFTPTGGGAHRLTLN